jgi:hypothetical protein
LATAVVRDRNGAAVGRARILYFSFLGAAIVLFTTASEVASVSGNAWTLGLCHFLILAAAIGCAIGAWYTAVMIASVHKVAWPLTLSTVLVVTACLIRLATWLRAA